MQEHLKVTQYSFNILDQQRNKEESKEPVQSAQKDTNQEMGKKYEEVKEQDKDEEMIDTTGKNKESQDVEMEEEKEPHHHGRHRADSEVIRSETNDPDRSEFSENFEIDPFFGRTVSVDAMNQFAHIQQRSGRSESIRNPILTSFWKSNDLGDKKKRIKPDQNYMKLEERGFTRHLMLEGEYDEALKHLESTFPEIMKSEKKIKTSINCLKFITILKSGKNEEAIEFGQNALVDDKEVEVPAVDNQGNY